MSRRLKEMVSTWKVFLAFLVLFIIMLVAAGLPSATVQALPEYSAQVGEPCASCHVSPSGGGPRAARGTAWVASSKPGVVPDLLQALEILGVRLTVDPLDYSVVSQEVEPADALQKSPIPAADLLEYLRDYEGN
jgi:mono/diheme cytochrome c family protein